MCWSSWQSFRKKTYVICHKKAKYACDCGCAPVRAEMPRQPIPKSRFSPILLAWIVVSKYIDGLPLYRLAKMLQRYGMSLSDKLMATTLVKASDHLERLTASWPSRLDAYDMRQCDETRLQGKPYGRLSNCRLNA